MIHMEKRHLCIIHSILSKYPYTFYAFSLRVRGTQRQLSDLDLCYKEDIPDSLIAHLAGDFSDSDLPFKVDIVNWNQCSSDFQKAIKDELEPISLSSTL